MLNGFIALPMAARIALVVIVSLALARFINWAIYNWAYTKSPFGPWAKPPAGCPVHTWRDHLPVIGWWRLRRESALHTKIFWIRPLLLELIFPVALASYYHFYVSGGTLATRTAAIVLQPELHSQFIGHYILLALMSIATFIDFDEHSIPDYVTVPGTVLGLLGAVLGVAWLPYSAVITPAGNVVGQRELLASLPALPPAWMGVQGLSYALLIVVVWGFALLERRWIGRRGIAKGVQYFVARMFRARQVWLPVLLATGFLLVVTSVAWQMDAARWPYYLSSLLGLAFAGGVTWAVRLSASWGLRVEALGFGDVTLMAMIGTYVGWQPSLLIFFIAPMVAIVFVMIRTLITGDSATPYGPYLCAAAVLILVFWNRVWNGYAEPLFTTLGPVILGIVVACVGLLGAILWIWRLIKKALGISFY